MAFLYIFFGKNIRMEEAERKKPKKYKEISGVHKKSIK
jgi:hypothetical protein